MYNAYTNTFDFPDFDTLTTLNGVTLPIGSIPSIALKLQKYSEAVGDWLKKYNIPQSVIDEWNAAQAASQKIDDNWWKKQKDKIKNIVNNTQNAVNNIVNQAQNAVQNGSLEAILLPLLPYVPVMKYALKKAGVPTNNFDLKDTVKLFYYIIVKGDKTYSLDYYKAFKKTKAGHHYGQETAYIEMAKEILPMIIELIKAFKKNDTSPEAKAALNETENLTKKVINENKPNITENKEGNIFKSFFPLLIGGGVLFLLMSKGGSK